MWVSGHESTIAINDCYIAWNSCAALRPVICVTSDIQVKWNASTNMWEIK